MRKRKIERNIRNTERKAGRQAEGRKSVKEKSG